MAIMCVGCGMMMERDDVSGHFVNPITGTSYEMCPSCAVMHEAVQPQMLKTAEGHTLVAPAPMTFKSVNQTRIERLQAKAMAQSPQKK